MEVIICSRPGIDLHINYYSINQFVLPVWRSGVVRGLARVLGSLPRGLDCRFRSPVGAVGWARYTREPDKVLPI